MPEIAAMGGGQPMDPVAGGVGAAPPQDGLAALMGNPAFMQMLQQQGQGMSKQGQRPAPPPPPSQPLYNPAAIQMALQMMQAQERR